MVELSNDLLTVSLHPKGAEIISIKGKKDQLNYMWRRDASVSYTHLDVYKRQTLFRVYY